MQCKICQANSSQFASAKIIDKYNISYFQCNNCGFIQTEDPYWLEEAYQNPIAKADTGLVARNIFLAKLTANVILNAFDSTQKFLDYGAGYGLLVRLLRSFNLEFYGYDKYCTSIFAAEYNIEENNNEKYELVTAFELFEHFADPDREISKILKFSRNILLSTEIVPCANPLPEQWAYYALDEGQHISFYTPKSLAILAQRFDLNFYTNGNFVHLLTEKKFPENLAEILNLKKFDASNMHFEVVQSLLYNIPINVLSTSSEQTVTENTLKTKNSKNNKIVLDGVFFQRYKTGIARVWESILKEWSQTDFANVLIVLDRAGTSPKIPGIHYRQIPLHDYNNLEEDRALLQSICDEEGAMLFISTYYTTPISTPSVFMGYDMIPEVLGGNLQEPMWQEKHYAIQHASAYITISENTARDLSNSFSGILPEQVRVAHCGIDPLFEPANATEIDNFKNKYGISKPYFLLIAPNIGYKNAGFFFQSFSKLSTRLGFELVCTGDSRVIEQELRHYIPGNFIHKLYFQDDELRLAYAGAIALIYPSKYEGFGLPVLEAMACGCPVITIPSSSIPEVAGEAAIYVKDGDTEGMIDALCDVQKPSIRQSLITRGLQQTKKFSWSKMANIVRDTLIETTLLFLNLKENNFIIFPDWSQEEEKIAQTVYPVLLSLAKHPQSYSITLLVEASNTEEEKVNLLISGVAMNLLMNEDLNIEEGMEVSIIPQLSDLQWNILCSKVRGRILLKQENNAIVADARDISTFYLDDLPL